MEMQWGFMDDEIRERRRVNDWFFDTRNSFGCTCGHLSRGLIETCFNIKNLI
jgi:hypothetical protein